MAFFIYALLPDRYAGMDGSFIGKDWSSCEYTFKLFEVEDTKVIFQFMKMYENILLEYRTSEAKKEHDKKQRQAQAGDGKNYTHNVKG